MENWTRTNLILSSRKKNILVDRQNFKFKRESESGARYSVCRLRDYCDVLQLPWVRSQEFKTGGLTDISPEQYSSKEFMFGLRGD